MTEMLNSGVELMVVGMGIVFLFLAMLIATVNAMSKIVQRYHSNDTAAGPARTPMPSAGRSTPVVATGGGVRAPMAGNILKVKVSVGSHVNEGDVVVIMEAMKMETEVRSQQDGIVAGIHIKEGDAVAIGADLISF